MVQKHPSQYFDEIEQVLRSNSGSISLDVMQRSVESLGCPKDMVDNIVNSAIAQEVNLIITPKEHNVTVTMNGREMPPVEDYNPSYNELLERMMFRFPDLGEDRIKDIINALISKQAISILEDGRLYRTKVLVPRMIVKINGE